jgi:hypothetical protein
MKLAGMLGKFVGTVVKGAVVGTVKVAQTAETAYHAGADVLTEAKKAYRENVGNLKFAEKTAIFNAFVVKAKTLATANDLHAKMVEAKLATTVYDINAIASLIFLGKKIDGLTADQVEQIRLGIQDELGSWDANKVSLVSKEINGIKLSALKSVWDERLAAK